MASFFSKTLNKDEFADILQQRPIKGDFQIDNIKISHFEFPVNAIELIVFTRNKWSEIDAKGRTFSDITFEDCQIDNSDFTGIILKNVVFKNCYLHNVIFNETQFNNLSFDSCDLSSNDPNINNSYRKMKGQSIHFTKSRINNITLFQSKAQIYIVNSNLQRFRGLGLEKGSLLSIDSTNAEQIDFSGSHLSSLTIKNSRIRDSKTNNATIETATLENSDLDFSIADSDLGTVNSTNTTNVVLGGSKVKNVNISSCAESFVISISEVKFETVDINNCSASKLKVLNSIGEKINISNGTFYKSDLRNIKIDNFKFENIRIRDILDYRNAQVRNFSSKNITLDDGVKVTSDGANFKIDITN